MDVLKLRAYLPLNKRSRAVPGVPARKRVFYTGGIGTVSGGVLYELMNM